MAQSSSYKQYARATRVLTEESGFAGGMMWTGNNIDETHLKAIVNCDYDDTTSYLKARDPFTSIVDAPTPDEFNNINFDLQDYRLLTTHSICAFDMDNDEALLNAGRLYVFTKSQSNANITTCYMRSPDVLFIYHTGTNYIKCEFASGVPTPQLPTEGTGSDVPTAEDTVVLQNTISSNILINYENQLYGIGRSRMHPDAWLFVYRVEHYTAYTGSNLDGVEGRAVECYRIRQLDYDTEVKSRIDSVGLLEACVSGFNAARGKDAFTYEAKPVEAPDVPYILGVYMKDEKGNDLVSPRVGQEVTIHVPTAYDNTTTGTKNYLALFQLKEGSDTTTTELTDSWQFVASDTRTDGEFVFKFTFQKKKTTLGFTYYGAKEPSATSPPPVYSDDAVDYLMPYQVVANDNLSNLKVKSYDLTNTNGSCLWNNKLCVWGTHMNQNSLFISEVDNFFYYPIPHNVALFDTNIISCIPYKDTLLVFTANKIYRVAENNDGSFTQTVIQNDMPLSQDDAAYLTAIKNMVLFKSGSYFYMIVPKTQSLTDELSIAPIYKNVSGFLNNLDNSVQEMLQLLYPEYSFRRTTTTTSLITPKAVSVVGPTSVYAERDTIHILYDVRATVETQTNPNKLSIYTYKMFLNYNTNLRAWTVYFEDTTNASLEVAYLATTRLMTFVRIYKSSNKPHDKAAFDVVAQQPSTSADTKFRILIDTGYRTLSAATQKRFREVQLKLHSASEDVTAFGTAFLVDGVWRRSYSSFQETISESNKISLMPTLDLNTFITELTMPVDNTGNIIKNPGSDSIELSSWTLDFSHFKREAPTTVRVPVSGKGYNPRFILMAPNAAGLTINEINWVYRLMHGR